MKTTFGIFIASLLFAVPALSCPPVGKLPDTNCDGKAVVTLLGDSLAYGIGDTKFTKGGYLARTAKKYKEAEFKNFGKPGQRASQLLLKLNKVLKPNSTKALKPAIMESDIVILDIGRNDRWFFLPPENTWRDLQKIAELITERTIEEQGYAPLVVTSVLMLPNRGSQGPWVAELNKYILKGNTPLMPADLRFDLVSKSLLSSDQIHPTSAGYDALSKVLKKYLKKKLNKKIKQFRIDQDADGIYDLFETLTFGTDPTLADTDGDLKSDGDEIFLLGTDPLTFD